MTNHLPGNDNHILVGIKNIFHDNTEIGENQTSDDNIEWICLIKGNY